MHSRTHVAKELKLYAPLVSKGSYLVVQDTIIDTFPEWIDRYSRQTEEYAGRLEEILAGSLAELNARLRDAGMPQVGSS